MAGDTERFAAERFPSDYASWRYCIEVKCGLALTPAFLQARIAVLGDPCLEETRRFAKLYVTKLQASLQYIGRSKSC